MKIAIVGAGISGLGAAWLLSRDHEVTIYEKNAYFGGHSNTVDVAFSGTSIPVDTGFIVYNEPNYPNLTALFKTLAVETIPSTMSFAVSVDNGAFEYAGTNLSTVFANKRNLLRLDFWRMLRDILKFNKRAEQLLQQLSDISLGNYLKQLGMSDAFKRYYLLPMAGAIWSCPLETMLEYPAHSFVRFFKNHGLLTVNDQPQWHSVKGGSREYVKKLLGSMQARLLASSPVEKVHHIGEKWHVITQSGSQDEYDHAVLATHGDEALKLLADPTEQEQSILQAFRYQKNRAVLHSDSSLMPKNKTCWASWAYLSGKDQQGADALSVTYWMNNLQSIDPQYPLFVTLNPLHEPAQHLTHGEYAYDHPIFTQGTLAAQAELNAIQNKRGLSFCGSYQRYGFHEDGLSSGIAVANQLGSFAPWQ